MFDGNFKLKFSKNHSTKTELNFSSSNASVLEFIRGSIVGRRSRKFSGTRSEQLQRRVSIADSEPSEVMNEMSKLTETEEAAVGSVSWALYGRYFKRMGLGFSITSSLAILFFHVANVYSNSELYFQLEI